MTYKRLLTFLILMLLATGTWADVYVGAGAGFSFPQNSPNLPSSSSSNQQYTYDANVGYQYNFNHSFSSGLEANYTNYGKTTYSPTATGGSSGSFKNSAIQLLITGTYLMDNGVNTFVKAGMAHSATDLDLSSGSAYLNDWIPAVAGGVGYYLLKNLNLYVQYQHNFGKDWSNASNTSYPSEPVSIDAVTAGVAYLFPM